MHSHLSPQGRPLTPRIYSTQTRFSRQIFLSRRTGMCTSPVARRTFPPASPTNKLPLSVGKTTKHKQRDQNDFATEALKWFLTKLALNKSPSQDLDLANTREVWSGLSLVELTASSCYTTNPFKDPLKPQCRLKRLLQDFHRLHWPQLGSLFSTSLLSR